MGLGCLISIFTVPFKFFKWALTNGVKGYIIGAVVLVMIIIGAFTIRGCIVRSFQPAPAITNPVSIPNRMAAPFEVKTASRTYYANLAVKDKTSGDVTMTDYYELLSGKWTLNKGVLVLDKKHYGEVLVRKRLPGQ